MKKSKIKYIFELVFIFILPLLFIIPNFSIEKNYVYDNEGNYQISNMYIYCDLDNIYTYQDTINNSYYSEYISCNIYDFINVDTININNNTRFKIPMSLISEEENYTSWILYYKATSNDYDIMFYYDFTNYYFYFTKNIGEEDYIKSLVSVIYEDTSYIIFQFNENINYTNSILNSEPDINETYFYSNYVEDIETINTSTLFGKLKHIINDNLHIDNIAINIIVYYTFIWFIMFVIWHLFYLLLDFLLHFWKKEDD